MSTISSIYDALQTLVGTTLFPTKLELVNPIDIPANADQILKNGWGIAVGNASNTFRQVSCQLSISRSFTFTLTRQIEAIHIDTAARATTEKALLEDHYTLIKELEKNAQLSGLYKKLDYQSDNGIEEIVADKKSFLMIQTQVEVEYFEAL